MATDHYKRLGIKKEEFNELNKQEKEELVDKQFKKLAPKGLVGFILTLLPEFLVPKKLKLLKSARDILNDAKVRKYYDFSLESGEKPNVDYKLLKNRLDNPSIFDNLIKEQQKELDNIKSRATDGKGFPTGMGARALNIEKTLEKLKETKSVIEKINSEASAQEEKIKEQSQTTTPLIDQNQSNEHNTAKNMDKKASNIPLTEGVQKLVSNAHKTIDIPVIPPLPEMQKLINQRQASKAKLDNQFEQIPPAKPPRLSVLNKQIQQQEGELAEAEKRFEEDLKKAGLDIKGMNDKEIQNELRYRGTLPLQFENILNKKSELFELNNKRAEMDKLGYQPKHDINNNIQEKSHAQQISQQREVSGQQKSSDRSV